MQKAPLCQSCLASRTGVFEPLEIPGVLAPLPGHAASVLPVAMQGQPLSVEATNPWPEFEDDPNVWMQFGLYVDGVIVDIVELLPPYDAATQFPVRFTVPADKLAVPHIYTLFYRVLFEDFNWADSVPVLLEVDHRAPNGDNPGEPLIFPPEVIRDGVTEAWLALNGDRLRVEVPRWPDMQLEDEVLLYWGGTNESVPVGRLVIDSSHLVPGTVIEFHYLGDTLREKGGGTHHGYYRLSDRAGNLGDPAPPVPIRVIDLPATPGDFPAPVVPLASVDKLIDLEDARTGVTVRIDEIADAAAGDTLQIWWNGRALPVLTLGDGFQWPQSAPVDWATLSADGFDGAEPCEVFYEWQRGGGAPRKSPSTLFEVDLSVAGPNPIGPDPINPGLATVVVKGLTGDNVLAGPDHGQDARVVVALYANPVVGELLELHWGDHPQPVDIHRVQAADRPGQEIVFSVPWDIIEAVGNDPALPVWYWVSNDTNRQRSADTPVRVAVLPLEGLGPVSFPDATLWGFINCEAEPWNGIRIRVPGNPDLLAAGDEIEVSWELCTGLTGEQPLLDTVFFPPVRLTATEAAQGLDFLMERFIDLVLPLQMEDGSANVGYRLTKVDGTPGISANKVVKISLVVPGNTKPCDGSS
ncbi:hypothetical protein [Pseudomonas sp. Marseille-P9899]|uniref:hypothetical protein n=1 Tax=Pseudomonas sp. Marseille-P9899 TaxID=2730401 RepID=UPI00158BA4F6|nr:hypothetical protein [Pseudomonas sp. Marseille-P9899]